MLASFSALEQELDLDQIELEAPTAAKLAALEAWRNLLASGDLTATVTMQVMPERARLVTFGPEGSPHRFLLPGKSARLALTSAESYVVTVTGRHQADQRWETGCRRERRREPTAGRRKAAPPLRSPAPGPAPARRR